MALHITKLVLVLRHRNRLRSKRRHRLLAHLNRYGRGDCTRLSVIPQVRRRHVRRRRHVGEDELVDTHIIRALIALVHRIAQLRNATRRTRITLFLLLTTDTVSLKPQITIGLPIPRNQKTYRAAAASSSCLLFLKLIAIMRHVKFSMRS